MTDESKTEEHLLTPAEVLKLIKKYRAKGPCQIGMFAEVAMPSDEGKYYPYYTLLGDMTIKQATRVLNDMQRFHENKAAAGQAVPKLRARVSHSDWRKNQTFIHFG